MAEDQKPVTVEEEAQATTEKPKPFNKGGKDVPEVPEETPATPETKKEETAGATEE